MSFTNNFVEVSGLVKSYTFKENDKPSSSGKTYWTGSIDIQNDEKNPNQIITVQVRNLLPEYNNGKENKTYALFDEDKLIPDETYVTVQKCSVTQSKGATYIEGVFVSIIKRQEYVNYWNLDLVINQINEVEDNKEDDYIAVSGFYVNAYQDKDKNTIETLRPITVAIKDEKMMEYFSKQKKKLPMAISLTGKVISTLITKQEIIENDFGEDEVRTRIIKSSYLLGQGGKMREYGDEESSIDADKFEKLLEEYEAKREFSNKDKVETKVETKKKSPAPETKTTKKSKPKPEPVEEEDDEEDEIDF